MAGLLVDEDLPRSLAPLLPASGFAADDVRDVGLRGRPDDEILAYASSRGAMAQALRALGDEDLGGSVVLIERGRLRVRRRR